MRVHFLSHAGKILNGLATHLKANSTAWNSETYFIESTECFTECDNRILKKSPSLLPDRNLVILFTGLEIS